MSTKSKMVRTLASSVAVEEPVPNPPKPMAISWPSWSHALGAMHDSPAIPTESEIRLRYNAKCGEPARSPGFEVAATHANVRVWVLDPHAHDVEGCSVYRLWLNRVQASSVRIVSRSLPAEIDQLRQRNARLEWRRLKPEIVKIVHDRFAIVDDELWHFGATVGGGHPSLNAYTRGFHAVETNMVEFFETVAWSRWAQP